ncbi:hypothetical protein [Pseudomonas sp.]|uniref:hypothetical protein n=1 Tax=Pseudomonas sp. TaxID=306 RepID=UPI0027353A58|nr:hypothetical protein [Pseudomonas sp.]MDP2746495.1 hypothetical protein [Pseudomonas sp.]
MNRLPTLIALLTASGLAHAANLPAFEVTCPTDLSVRAEAGGPVYINDKQIVLHKLSEQFFEAKGEGVTLSISLNAAGTPTVSYTGKQGANGICEKTEKAPQEEASATDESAEPMAD